MVRLVFFQVPLAKDDQTLMEYDVKANDKLLLVSLLHLSESTGFHCSKNVIDLAFWHTDWSNQDPVIVHFKVLVKLMPF